MKISSIISQRKKAIMNRLLKIDELVMGDHFYLRNGDECYYFMEYHSRGGYAAGPGNQLVSNFKKPLSYRGTNAWQYKSRAITEVARMFKESLSNVLDFANSTLVPIPPSKIKTNPEHDDRMLQALQQYCQGVHGDIRELIALRSDMQAVHESDHRPTPQELEQNMIIDDNLVEGIKDTIFLFDDVITTGSHYIACKHLIQQTFPGKIVIGVFIARRKIEALDFF